MLEVKKVDKEDIGEVSNLISLLNNSEESHIGFCGKDKKEIAKYMLVDITDVKYNDSFVGAYENNQLVGVLGFEADLEDRSAEIWGPFINANKWPIVFDMWEKTIELLPDEIDSLEMFPNSKNIRVCELATNLSFKKYSDETILNFDRNNSRELKGAFLEELTPEYYLDMKLLHDKTFPGAYYNGQQIINRINDHGKVFVITSKDDFRGYIYIEAEPEFGEASIEFFAVRLLQEVKELEDNY